MIVRFIPSRPHAAHLLLALVAALAPASNLRGGETEPDGSCSYATCPFELADTEELCGWIDTCTHDSYPTPIRLAEANRRPVDTVPAESTIQVAVEQIAEPFAVVGPYVERSLESVRVFQQWWNRAIDEAEDLRAADEAASSMPIDYEKLGPSVLVREDDGLNVTTKFIGTAPIIVTLDASYMPYDVADADMKLWSVFAMPTHPFCIRSQRADDMWEDYKQSIHGDFDAMVSRETETPTICGSADCILDEWMWKIQRWTDDDSALWATIDPNHIGRQWAGIASRSTIAIQELAIKLAMKLPSHRGQPKPSATGAALLARAGAIEAAQPVIEARIAEVSVGSLQR